MLVAYCFLTSATNRLSCPRAVSWFTPGARDCYMPRTYKNSENTHKNDEYGERIGQGQENCKKRCSSHKYYRLIAQRAFAIANNAESEALRRAYVVERGKNIARRVHAYYATLCILYIHTTRYHGTTLHTCTLITPTHAQKVESLWIMPCAIGVIPTNQKPPEKLTNKKASGTILHQSETLKNWPIKHLQARVSSNHALNPSALKNIDQSDNCGHNFQSIKTFLHSKTLANQNNAGTIFY